MRDTCYTQEKKDAKNGNILDFMKMEEDESNEPLSLADRLKLKGSPVDAIKGGGIEVKKAAQKKEPKGIFSKLDNTSTSYYLTIYRIIT